MSGLGETAFMLGAPEVGIPLEVGKQLAPHASTLALIPMVTLSIIIVIVGIIVLAASSNKAPGAILTTLGFLLGGGAFFIMYRSESKVRKNA